MSHASTTATRITSHSTRTTEAAPGRPLLVVETLDHSAGSTTMFSFGMEAAAAGAAEFTFCVQEAAPETAQFTFCVLEAAPETAQFTFCVQQSPADAFGAETAAPPAVEGDAVTGPWR